MVGRSECWQGAGVRECRGCWHGYRLRFNLDDFYQRWAYFLARYHEVPLQLLLRHALRPGDTLVDGGANIGLVSLVGAWIVGPEGRVLAFEPNPRAFESLRWHVATNRLDQVRCVPAGLGDQDAELRLQLPRWENLGAGTFCPLPERYGGVVADSCTARIVRGDDALDLPDAGEVVIKLDIEGFETRALRGLERTLASRRPLVVTELNRELLVASGSSPYELFHEMHAHGYEGFGFDDARAVVRRRRLVLWRVRGTGPRMPRDIAWVHPDSEAARRLRPLIADPPPQGAMGADYPPVP